MMYKFYSRIHRRGRAMNKWRDGRYVYRGVAVTNYALPAREPSWQTDADTIAWTVNTIGVALNWHSAHEYISPGSMSMLFRGDQSPQRILSR